MNISLLICLLVISITVFSCNTNENNATSIKAKDSVNTSLAEAQVMPKAPSVGEIEGTFDKQKVDDFIQWFKEQNKPFGNLSDTITIVLNEGEEWDGVIPDYNNKYQETILVPLRKSIAATSLFTDSYKNKLLNLLNNYKSNNFVLNLPSLLLESEHAFQLSHIFFDQIYDLNKKQAEKGSNSKIKHPIPANSKLILCNTGYNLAAADDNPVILVYLKENGEWKIADIFSEYDLFE